MPTIKQFLITRNMQTNAIKLANFSESMAFYLRIEGLNRNLKRTYSGDMQFVSQLDRRGRPPTKELSYPKWTYGAILRLQHSAGKILDVSVQKMKRVRRPRSQSYWRSDPCVESFFSNQAESCETD